jgi:hypothetical protein
MRAPVLIAMLLVASAGAAAEATRLTAANGSAVVLDGSSNVADWRCRGTEIDAEMTVATSAAHLNEVIDRVEDGNIGVWISHPELGRFPTPDFALTIPVTTFRCGNWIMESDMRNALKADRHPNVAFTFRELRGGVEHDLDSGLYHATIAGELTLAGMTRSIDVKISAQRLSRSSFRVHAVLPLRMTDFGITPPSALFGAIRARNSLTVRFDLILNVAQPGRRQS